MLTTRQVENETKTVTRRLGWLFVRPRDILNAVEKCQGLKKDEKVKKLKLIQVVSKSREPLKDIDYTDCIREGFPELRPAEFVDMFCKSHKKCVPDTIVTRIEFKYLPDCPRLAQQNDIFCKKHRYYYLWL